MSIPVVPNDTTTKNIEMDPAAPAQPHESHRHRKSNMIRRTLSFHTTKQSFLFKLGAPRRRGMRSQIFFKIWSFEPGVPWTASRTKLSLGTAFCSFGASFLEARCPKGSPRRPKAPQGGPEAAQKTSKMICTMRLRTSD